MAGSARSRSARASADRRTASGSLRSPRRGGAALLAAGALVAAAIPVACDPFAGPDGDVTVIVDAAHFDFDEEIRFEVRNRTAHTIIYQQCADGRVRMPLIRRLSGNWSGFGDTCPPREDAVLLPGDRVAGRRSGVAAEGLYALRFDYRVDADFVDGAFGLEPVWLISNSRPFHVTP